MSSADVGAGEGAGASTGASLRHLLGSDEVLGVFVPIIVYWLYAGFYDVLEAVDPKWFNSCRLHSKAEEGKNLVSRGEVVRGVLFQQLLQAIAAFLLLYFDPTQSSSKAAGPPSLWVQAVQVGVAMFVMDAWQYFMHRLMHESRFLYRHLHSWHHRLLVPYAYGALYNHPLEGVWLDTMGGVVSFLVSGMHPRTAIFFFTFATMKTVDDHCGVVLPVNPFQQWFQNNAAYHDIHHQLSGFRHNYSQPFFPLWDYLLGTHMPYMVRRRADGLGLEAHALASGKVAKSVAASSTVTSGVEREKEE